MPAKTASAVNPFADLLATAETEPKKERDGDRDAIDVPPAVLELVKATQTSGGRTKLKVVDKTTFDALALVLRAAGDRLEPKASVACRALYGDKPEDAPENWEAPLVGLSFTVSERRGKKTLDSGTAGK